MRTGDLELLREKRAIKVMEAQSQLPGHILEVVGTVAGAGEAAVMTGQSPSSCCWKRKGCETHLSESGAAPSLPANWAGPWGEDSQGRKCKSGSGRASRIIFSFSCGSSFLCALWFCHIRRWESHMSLFTGRGSCPAAEFLLQRPTPHSHHTYINTHTHKHLVFGWHCPLLEHLPA